MSIGSCDSSSKGNTASICFLAVSGSFKRCTKAPSPSIATAMPSLCGSMALAHTATAFSSDSSASIATSLMASITVRL